MGKFPLESTNQHRNRGVASGLQSFAHLLKIHFGSQRALAGNRDTAETTALASIL